MDTAGGSASLSGRTFLTGGGNMGEGFNQLTQSWHVIEGPTEHEQHYLQTKYA